MFAKFPTATQSYSPRQYKFCCVFNVHCSCSCCLAFFKKALLRYKLGITLMYNVHTQGINAISFSINSQYSRTWKEEEERDDDDEKEETQKENKINDVKSTRQPSERQHAVHSHK